jgi:hypothetical protein
LIKTFSILCAFATLLLILGCTGPRTVNGSKPPPTATQHLDYTIPVFDYEQGGPR